MKLNKTKENAMKEKETTFLIIAIMLLSLVLSFIYVHGTIESRIWNFIYITSLIILGILAFIPLIIKITHKFRKADTLNSSEKDFKTIIQRKFKYVIVIFLYMLSFCTLKLSVSFWT